jgi:hypothetical protein
MAGLFVDAARQLMDKLRRGGHRTPLCVCLVENCSKVDFKGKLGTVTRLEGWKRPPALQFYRCGAT